MARSTGTWRLACVGLAMLGGAHASRADYVYVDVGAARGMQPFLMAEGYAGGAAAADYDDDGDVDLFVPTEAGTPDQLYRNLGDGTFEEIAASAGVDSLERGRVGLFLDYDADGDLDLLVARDGWHAAALPTSTLQLFRYDGGDTFTDVTVEAGLFGNLLDADATHIGGLAAGDLNGDGFLDLFMSQWDGWLFAFLNDGNGAFTDVSGLSDFGVKRQAWQPVMHDFDGDGRLDVFLAVDYGPNRLWLNQGGGAFTDAAPAAGMDSAWNEMGVAIGDIDNDGDADLYVTNITVLGKHNLLYRNDTVGGVPAFTDVSIERGVDDTEWGWGVSFLDADRDGWLDIAVTNGFWTPPWNSDPSHLFRNPGAPTGAFTDVSVAAGVVDQDWGSALLAFDLERDGDLDLLQACALGGPLRLMECAVSGSTATTGYLVVKPRMAGNNRRAIGAVVRVVANGQSMMRVITAGTSTLGQEPAEAHFGLGSAHVADLVRVEWPDGRVTELTNVTADRVITVTDDVVIDPCPVDLDGSGSVDFTDLLIVLSAWGPCPPGGPCPADLDVSGSVDFVDLLTVLSGWGPCAS